MKNHNWKHISILILILILGVALRIYSINFPSVGYHNLKENEYLSMAQEMRRTGDYATRRIYFYSGLDEEPTMKIYPQPAIVSYQILLAWRLLGDNIWGPRLFQVIFGVLSILIMYYIALILFRNPTLALFSALMLAIMPLHVFFSRNIQPESPGFFFMILGNLLYLKFIVYQKKTDLFLGGVAFSIAWLYKFNFVLGILPFAICFPYKNILSRLKDKKESLRFFISLATPFLLITITIIFLKSIGEWQFKELGRIKPAEPFSSAYWKEYGKMIWWYIQGENFTIVYTVLSVAGVTIAFSKMRGLLNRYIIGWTITIVPYTMLFSDYINQHNYYQMPFLILVCIATTYAILTLSEKIKRALA